MEYSTPTVKRISQNFERHNPYAEEMLRLRNTDDKDYDAVMLAWAIMAVAYEMSQIRYQITQGVKQYGEGT